MKLRDNFLSVFYYYIYIYYNDSINETDLSEFIDYFLIDKPTKSILHWVLVILLGIVFIIIIKKYCFTL